MTTRMIHPIHGATHVYDLGEQKRLEKSGWKVETPEVLPALNEVVDHVTAVAQAAAAFDAALEENVVPIKRKPGRPKGK